MGKEGTGRRKKKKALATPLQNQIPLRFHSSKSPSVALRKVSHFGVSFCSLSTKSAPGVTAASGKLLGWRHSPCHGRKAQSLLAPGCRALDCARRGRWSRCWPPLPCVPSAPAAASLPLGRGSSGGGGDKARTGPRRAGAPRSPPLFSPRPPRRAGHVAGNPAPRGGVSEGAVLGPGAVPGAVRGLPTPGEGGGAEAPRVGAGGAGLLVPVLFTGGTRLPPARG